MRKLLKTIFSNSLSKSRKTSLRGLLPESLLDWYYYYSTDVFLISYPKCGRTWLRMMLGHILTSYFGVKSDNLLDLRAIARKNAAIPTIRTIHENNPHYSKPVEIKQDKSKYYNKKVIFLVRDPRDVMVSLYFHQSKRVKILKAFEGSLEDYIYQDVGSIDTIITYFNVWMSEGQRLKDFLFVRYEDMRRDPIKELKRVVDFIGLEQISEADIKKAVELSSFEKMRGMEKKGQLGTRILQPGDKKDEESFKTRKGKVGGYRDYLEQKEIDYLNKKLESLNELLGYK